MNVLESIRSQFGDFGVKLSEATLLGIIDDKTGLDADAEVTKSNRKQVAIAIVRSIPRILLMPQSVSEGSVSITRTKREDLLAWYRMRCKELGIKDELTKRPTVTFL